MDKFPLLLEGRPAGELTARWEDACTWFDVRGRLPEAGLWCAWAVGDRGELRLGVLERAGEAAVLRRRFSDRMTVPLGCLLRGEVRPAEGRPPSEKAGNSWKPVPRPESLFRADWLCRRLRSAQGAMARREEGRLYLALPWDPGKPFPLTTLFCFARVRTLNGRPYAVFAFDREGCPVFH